MGDVIGETVTPACKSCGKLIIDGESEHVVHKYECGRSPSGKRRVFVVDRYHGTEKCLSKIPS